MRIAGFTFSVVLKMYIAHLVAYIYNEVTTHMADIFRKMIIHRIHILQWGLGPSYSGHSQYIGILANFQTLTLGSIRFIDRQLGI